MVRAISETCRTKRSTQVANRPFPDGKFTCRDWVIAGVRWDRCFWQWVRGRAFERGGCGWMIILPIGSLALFKVPGCESCVPEVPRCWARSRIIEQTER